MINKNIESEIKKILYAINGLVCFQNIRKTNLFRSTIDFLTNLEKIITSPSSTKQISKLIKKYSQLFSAILPDQSNEKPDFSVKVMTLLEQDENFFSFQAASRDRSVSDFSQEMKQIIFQDLEKCILILSFSSSIFLNYLKEEIGCVLPSWHNEICFSSTEELFTHLWDKYSTDGFGMFAKYHAFIWKNKKLDPVRNPDSIKREQLFSYEYELDRIEENTKRLLKGKRGENLLLFGARGTGKSSIVKAMANDYHSKGLRLIEINKDDLLTISELLEYLSEFLNTQYSFLLFLDDLTFSEDDVRYTALKTLLEGGMKARPLNTAIYATSNRRHIVVEKKEQDLYTNDGRNERLSLSDRFGIAIRFASPTQSQYLEIVRGILTQRNLSFSLNKIEKEAVTWAMKENGFSPRTARQFCDYYEGT